MSILKKYLDIWFIPTTNPEGLNVVHDELDLSYRKNKTDFSPEVFYQMVFLIMILPSGTTSWSRSQPTLDSTGFLVIHFESLTTLIMRTMIIRENSRFQRRRWQYVIWHLKMILFFRLYGTAQDLEI